MRYRVTINMLVSANGFDSSYEEKLENIVHTYLTVLTMEDTLK